MPKIEKRLDMVKKREEVKKLLEQANESEIHVIYLPGGGARVDFEPHADTPQEVMRWKESLKKAEGMWKDREDIVEEMEIIREEADRSFREKE